ncbi:Hint domain-containing protein [Alkalilacustris brevis]|uniref:Hint domain-containing protein n=1 Tax=Alkalilacustris brevis TaxID=2026338 RepID=UPI000E0DD645|nr:Hint domain-containing protein [Alkalilacustris brevis]
MSEEYFFTSAWGFFAGKSGGFQTTNNDLGSSGLIFKKNDDAPDGGDLSLEANGEIDPNTLVSLDGGDAWVEFKTIASGPVTFTPSIYNAADTPEFEEPVIATVIEVDGEQFVFFPEYPDATGKLPGLIKIDDDGNIIFVCFVAGTMILTPEGEVPVESLKAGDLVMTRDHGAQPIRWVGSATVPASETMAPVRIRAGALGEGLPSRDLRVSPQHRLLVSGPMLELTMGLDEALVPAKHLINDSTISRDRSERQVTYYHLLFDQHEIITSDGMPTESFHPGKWGVGVMEESARQELLRLFPELEHGADRFGPAARTSLKKDEAALLAIN